MAVDNQIRITPDRRGEVGIVSCSKTKMTDVTGQYLACCMLPQQQVVEDVFVSGSCAFIKNTGKPGWSICKRCHRRIEGFDKVKKFFRFYQFRRFMYPKYCRFCCSLKSSATASLRQHEFFNNLVGNVSFCLADQSNFSRVRQGEFRLDQIKVNRPAFFSFGLQSDGQFFSPFEPGEQGFVVFPENRVFVDKNPSYRRIGETLSAANY